MFSHIETIALIRLAIKELSCEFEKLSKVVYWFLREVVADIKTVI